MGIAYIQSFSDYKLKETGMDEWMLAAPMAQQLKCQL